MNDWWLHWTKVQNVFQKTFFDSQGVQRAQFCEPPYLMFDDNMNQIPLKDNPKAEMWLPFIIKVSSCVYKYPPRCDETLGDPRCTDCATHCTRNYPYGKVPVKYTGGLIGVPVPWKLSKCLLFIGFSNIT